MKNLYKRNDANYPRLQTDKFFTRSNNKYAYNGVIEQTIKFIQEFQLLNPQLWHRFVMQFREDADFDAGWRGEYWGKMMRGACYVYSYTQNAKLYEILTKSVEEMMDCGDELGRISSYAYSHEFDGWDIWNRKYVLLGMQYFLEICKEKNLSKKITFSMCRQMDYIISKIGDEEGKKPIVLATRHWRGLNSCSLLEPVVRLYTITGEEKYFRFAQYIVGTGGTDVENIFDLAYEDKLYPYQYPVTKAYEMMSCFEGLLEFYRITKIEKYKTAIIRFADKILESDFTVIGCCGCTEELFDHSTVRQANPTKAGAVQQETCVTVTLMKFMHQVHLLTGDSKYVDAFEISLYNAYLGAVNTEKVVEPMIKREYPQLQAEAVPFDSYSPLTLGTRGNGIGGFKIMSDKHYYGCCACIGAVGIGLVPKMQLLTTQEGFVYNLFIDGIVQSHTPKGNKIQFTTTTKYPVDGQVYIQIQMDKDEEFTLLLRNPYWSKDTSVALNKETIQAEVGYISIRRVWKNADKICLRLDMRTKAIYPISYGAQILMNKVIWGHNYIVPTYDEEPKNAKHHIALQRGPIMLAQDERLGYNAEIPIDVRVDESGYVETPLVEEGIPYQHILAVQVPLSNGETILLTDYGSSGKNWDRENKIAVWMRTKGFKG